MTEMRFLERTSRRLVVLGCSATKRPGADAWRAGDARDGYMRAFDRYDGPLWQTLRTVNPDGKLAQVACLSARYGFVHADEPILDYDARLTDELADRMVERGLDARWPIPKPGTMGPLPGAFHMIQMAEGRRAPLDDVALVGGATYLRVMQAHVTEAQRRGWVAADATVALINGPIGLMRQELRAWLGAPLRGCHTAGQPQPATEPLRLGDELVEQALVPGVAPVSLASRELEAFASRRAARRGSAAPPAGGLFDEGARAQLELF